MKILVIANPVAGRGRAARQAQRVLRLLEARQHQVQWFATGARGDAERRVGELEGGLDCIVCGGGDGTLSEIVNGLADPSATPILPVFAGTANNLARDLGIPRRAEALAGLVERGTIRRIDLGSVGGRRFLTTVSSGFDAMVTQIVRRTRTGRLGYRGYLRAILAALRTYSPPELVVRVDEGEAIPGAMVVVSKVRSYAGMFVLTPAARCDSGQLEVCIARSAGVADLLRYALAARWGGLSRLRSVEFRSGRRVRIEAREPVAVEVDGDYWGTTPVTVDLRPRVVPILVPSDSDPNA